MSAPPSPAIQLAKLAIAYQKAFTIYFPDPAAEMAELATAYLLAEGIRYFLSADERAITCVRCRRTSYNLNDVAQRYCGYCKEIEVTP